MGLTTDKNDPRLGHGTDDKPVPQNEVYLILSEEERKKGFVRPVRESYIHVGKQIDISNMIPIDEYIKNHSNEFDEERIYLFKNKFKYIGYIPYSEDMYPLIGRYVIAKDLEVGCGVVTRMATEIAETYARNPKFYNSTYCSFCHKHLPVEEFLWEGTNIRVGE